MGMFRGKWEMCLMTTISLIRRHLSSPNLLNKFPKSLKSNYVSRKLVVFNKYHNGNSYETPIYPILHDNQLPFGGLSFLNYGGFSHRRAWGLWAPSGAPLVFHFFGRWEPRCRSRNKSPPWGQNPTCHSRRPWRRRRRRIQVLEHGRRRHINLCAS